MKSTLHFDYLRDGAPEVVERLRAARIPRELQSAACSVAAAFFVVLGAWGIETYRVADARAVETLAAQRVEVSRADLARTDLARTQIEKLLRLDARLSDIRLSGARLSARLADIADHVPRRAWLTSISRDRDGIAIAGHTEGLRVLSDTVASLMSAKTIASPALLRADKEDRTRGHGADAISFEMRVEEAKR